MKKIFNLAVVTLMSVLCAVMFGSCGEQYTDDNKVQPTPEPTKTVRLLKCFVPRIDYATDGEVVQTRSYESAQREGYLSVISYHELWAMLGTDTIKHTYQGRFVVNAFDVKKTRYAYNSDIFKNPVIKPQTLSDGRTLNVVTFKDTETRDFDIALVEELPYYEEDTFLVGDSLLKLCKNERILLELVDSKVEATTSPDDKYNAITVALYFQYGLSEGPDNKKTFLVRLPLVLIPKGGTDQPLPDEKHDVVEFADENKGFDRINPDNDSINNRWIDMVKVLSNGDREPFPRVAFLSKNRLLKPAYQIKSVTSFDWQSFTAKPFDPVKKGEIEKRENNIYVQPMAQLFTTYTDKGNCVFTGEYDGPAYFVDSLGQKHYFLDREYTFEDDGWQRSDMTPTENMERKLLTSSIRGFFNGATLPRTGEIELRKVKDTKVPVGPWYSPLDSEESGLKYISEGVYETFRTKYLLFSDNTKELVGRVPIRLYLSATAPNKATIDVTDWNITDVQAQSFDPRRQKARNDTTSYGVAKITPFLADFKTKTNKSTSPFTYTYDGAVVLIDPDTKEEIEFIPLTVTPEDLGGVRTLKDLMEEDDYERKSMTTSMKVTETHTNTFITKEAEILFRKAVEKEELINDPNEDVELDLKYIGNGIWNTSAKIKYVWKLKGTEYEPIALDLDCSLKGEAKSQLIREKAEAPFNRSDFNNAWSAETKTYPQDFVTLYTKTKSLSEDYTTLTDKYTAQLQYAVIEKTVGGKHIYIKMLAPTDMTFTHNEGSLKDGQRTVKKDGTEYNVWDHTGSVSATVISPKGNQTETAIDEKEILVKKEEIPAHPEWGKPVKILGQGTFVYMPAVGANSQGRFYENFNVLYEKGIVCLVTSSYVTKNYTNPMDFQVVGFYPFGSKLRGKAITEKNCGDLNSAIWRGGAWEPACCTEDTANKKWTYMSPDGYDQGMDQKLAETCGLKNFTGSHTAELKPWLYFSSSLSNGVLTIKNNKGVGFMTLR